MKKNIPLILSSLVVAFGVGVLVAHAQSYEPLAPLPIGEGGTTPEAYTMTTYLSGAIKLLIAIGGALSILMAIIGGAQYVTAGIAPSAKQDAKNRILNAFTGLALILSSYLILNSINPKLVEFDLSLESVTPEGLEVFREDIWGDDSGVRNTLANGTRITVNKANCPTIGASDCTSVHLLHGDAISGLRTLYDNCENFSSVSNCDITVTGGTEYWLHRSHNDRRKVDLSLNYSSVLTAYIKKNGLSSVTSCGVPTDQHYQPDGSSGGIYVDEPNRDGNGVIDGSGRHWHVCF